MKLKKVLFLVMLIAIIVSFIAIIALSSAKRKEKSTDKIDVVVTNFPAYDFVRQIAGDKANITYLLGPGVDAHSYEPTAQDLIDIQNADIFIYVGGNMEKWADRVLETLDVSDTKIVKLTDMVTLEAEEPIDGAEHNHGNEHNEEAHSDEHHDEEEHHEFDEHIWTSPANGIILVQNIAKILSETDTENAKLYEKNANNYISEIQNVQNEINTIVQNKKRDRLVFGDKMPMQYFLKEFGLTATAAFTGCSTETEPSAQTIAYLTKKVKEDNIPVVLYIELSTGKVANTISDETGVEAMQIQTLHNVSREDFENGETYVSLMLRNLDVLERALY